MGSGFIYKLILALFLLSLAWNWNDRKEYFESTEQNVLLVLQLSDLRQTAGFGQTEIHFFCCFLKHKEVKRKTGKWTTSESRPGGGVKTETVCRKRISLQLYTVAVSYRQKPCNIMSADIVSSDALTGYQCEGGNPKEDFLSKLFS